MLLLFNRGTYSSPSFSTWLQGDTLCSNNNEYDLGLYTCYRLRYLRFAHVCKQMMKFWFKFSTKLAWAVFRGSCGVPTPWCRKNRAWFVEILSWNGSCEPKQSTLAEFAAVALQCLVKVRYFSKLLVGFIAKFIRIFLPDTEFTTDSHVLPKIIKTVETLMPLSRPKQCWKTSLKCGRVWYVQWPLEKRYLWIYNYLVNSHYY